MDGNLLASFILPEPITSVLLDPLETTLFAGSLSGKIYLISLEQLRTSTLQPNQAVILFNLIDQDNSLAKNFSILQGQQDQVTSLRLSLDARFLLSSDTLGQVHLWDLSTRIRFKCAKLSSQPVIYLNCTIMPKFMNRHPTKKEADQLAPPSLAPFKKQIANIYEKALCHKDKADKMGGNFEIEHSFSVELKDQYAKLHEAYTKLEQKVLDGIFSTV